MISIRNKTAVFAVFLIRGLKHYAQMAQNGNADFLGNIRRRVAELRNEKGLTQEELAEKVEIDVKTLQKWECEYITLKAITKLSEVLNCSPYDFFKIPRTQGYRRGRPRKNNKKI